MIEVEAKAEIKNPGLFRKKALALGKYIGKDVKVDDYYALFHPGEYPHKSLRIRKHKGYYEVNFKQKISYVEHVHAKKETEFRVSNIDDFLSLIKDFGYKKWLRKEKTSYVYELGKRFHIEINFVKGLGWFAEVEYLARTPKEIAHARDSVIKVMKKLGISQDEIVKKGYTKLLWEKRHRVRT